MEDTPLRVLHGMPEEPLSSPASELRTINSTPTTRGATVSNYRSAQWSQQQRPERVTIRPHTPNSGRAGRRDSAPRDSSLTGATPATCVHSAAPPQYHHRDSNRTIASNVFPNRGSVAIKVSE